MQEKQRIDVYLFEHGLAESREKARALIMSGEVFVNDQRVDKPGTNISPEAHVEVRGNTCPYVSRGGLKLEKALRWFGVDPTGFVCSDSGASTGGFTDAGALDALGERAPQVEGRRCLDAGASTGGFTDVLLRRGATHVAAADVGYGQLAWKIRNDARVVTMERTNIRHVTPEQLGEPLDLSVVDVSFISLKLVCPLSL